MLESLKCGPSSWANLGTRFQTLQEFKYEQLVYNIRKQSLIGHRKDKSGCSTLLWLQTWHTTEYIVNEIENYYPFFLSWYDSCPYERIPTLFTNRRTGYLIVNLKGSLAQQLILAIFSCGLGHFQHDLTFLIFCFSFWLIFSLGLCWLDRQYRNIDHK